MKRERKKELLVEVEGFGRLPSFSEQGKSKKIWSEGDGGAFWDLRRRTPSRIN
ncbi:hypothetical protein [Deinococcus wulumuqiensis]|uniref:hypothetical protein n=1 Tax=Deinococcus wulumuqiensis TaxID=980427 RepID=UPI001375BC40|nr:hypothetical protein [Deinococcus wulumuqiensis]QII19752.1 hypothetical protein G6R31_02540 [Deinococcus wulumuqiensis R12]